MADFISNIQTDNWDDLRLDLEKLSDRELEELARLVVIKLRESMRQEMDRAGRV